MEKLKKRLTNQSQDIITRILFTLLSDDDTQDEQPGIVSRDDQIILYPQ